MAGETILVIDAEPELNQRMTGALEAKGYLVFTDSSRVVTAEIVRQLSPSLIYVNPPELSPAGFEFCRAIHNNPLLKDVPIVILGSLEPTLRKKEGPRYFREYGIVDFLKSTFDPDELIKKTKEMLGEATPSLPDQEDTSASEHHLSPNAVKGTGKKRSSFFLPAIGAIILLLIAGGFLIYQKFVSSRKVVPLSTLKVPLPLPSKAKAPAPSAAPEAKQIPPLPPEKKAKETSAPVSVPAAAPPAQNPPVSSITSQPPAKPFYSVQLGAFKNEDRAQVLTKKLRDKGYDAFTQPGSAADKSPIYRVLVSKYEDRKAAEKQAREIESKEELKATLYSE